MRMGISLITHSTFIIPQLPHLPGVYFVLRLNHSAVKDTPCCQFLVRTRIQDAALIHHDNLIGVSDSVQVMCNRDNRFVFA